jgi:IS30 family transposase
VPNPGLPPERVALVVSYLEAGLLPPQAARAAGVSAGFAYQLDRKMTGVSRGAVKLAAAAARAAERAAHGDRRLVRPERERLLLEYLAAGVTPNRAGPLAGVSKTFAYGLYHKIGGVCRPPGTTYSDRYLDREKRDELARLREAGLSLRAIGQRIGVHASTVCRELARNADPKTGHYLPVKADRLAWERQRRPKPSKLSGSPALRQEVQAMLGRRYSPEEISGRLKVLHPDDEAMRVSHETIYQSIYLYPRGGLRRELQASLRSGRELRRRRGREPRGQIIGAVPIGQRPPEVEGRLVPGHHEGDLLMGTTASNSAVGTIVERTTGYLTLLHLPHGRDAGSVAEAIIDRMTELPAWFARTLTWDRGRELARHQHITETTGIAVYFADPYSPWQRGSNENINGLLREYLPKGTDLSVHTAADLQHIADELNDRPRKRFGYYTPREQLAKLLAQETECVATTP